jgi:DNA helicase-2/ATP-dependent DNA helicase PcrA
MDLTDRSIPVRRRGNRWTDLPAVRAALARLHDAARAPAADGDHQGRFRAFVAWQEALEESLAADDGAESPAEGDAVQRRALATAAAEYASTELQPTPGGFMAWLNDATDTLDAVDVVTFHAAKGLEWREVVIAAVEEGFVPVAGATSVEAAAEEVRLLHVAVTRASDRLWCTWAQERPPRSGGRPVQRQPSPLLASLTDLATSAAPAASPPPLPRPPRRAPPPEPEVLGVLRAWRREVARAGRVSERAVVDDDCLAAVAGARPTTLDDLAKVPGFGLVRARRLGPGLLAALGSRAAPAPTDRARPSTARTAADRR